MNSEVLFKAFLGVEIISHAVRLMGKALVIRLSSGTVQVSDHKGNDRVYKSEDFRKQYNIVGELVFEAAICVGYTIAFCITVAGE